MSSFAEQELQGGGVIAMETPKHTRIKSYGKIIISLNVILRSTKQKIPQEMSKKKALRIKVQV